LRFNRQQRSLATVSSEKAIFLTLRAFVLQLVVNGPTRKPDTALNRGYTEFRRRFDVEIHSVVPNIGEDEIESD
jgi:hypothetical protein